MGNRIKPETTFFAKSYLARSDLVFRLGCFSLSIFYFTLFTFLILLIPARFTASVRTPLVHYVFYERQRIIVKTELWSMRPEYGRDHSTRRYAIELLSYKLSTNMYLCNRVFLS